VKNGSERRERARERPRPRRPRFLRDDEIPKAVRDLRLVGLRSYDAQDHMLYDLTLVTENAQQRVEKFLGDPRTSNVNIHSSGPGCYLCRVERL